MRAESVLLILISTKISLSQFAPSLILSAFPALKNLDLHSNVRSAANRSSLKK